MAWTEKKEAFCQEYIKDFNASRAGAAIGYSEKTAGSQGSRLLKDVEIKKRIEELKAERAERVKIDADYVLKQAVKLHERCMQEVRPFTNMKGEQIHDDDGNPLYVFDARGAAAALQLVGKHVSVNAFVERVEHTGKVEVVNRVLEARKRARGGGNE